MKKIAAWTFGFLGFLLWGGGASAAELKVGDSAPEFALPGTDGKTYRLSDILKRQLAFLVFYPGNNTPG